MFTSSLQTSQLKLRQWQDLDYSAFAKLNADLEVMRYFPTPLTETESHKLANRLKNLIDSNGYGFWAVELLPSHEFIGFVGLNKIDADTALAKELKIKHSFIEIGWRLAKEHWGKGYATESAKLALDYAFNELKVDKVYSFTAAINKPSQKVMQRIGMVNTNKEFNHPHVKKGHELQKHCLFSMTHKQFMQTKLTN